MEKKERHSLYPYLILTVAVLTVFLIFKPGKYVSDPLKEALRAYRDGKYKQAFSFFIQADKLNIPEASFSLGAMYFSGKGTSVNIPQALFYYRKAAQRDYAPAKTTMALLYMEGKNVPKDPEKAVSFAESAAEQNDAEAQIMLAKWFENGQNVKKDISKAIRYYEMAAKNGDINAKMALSVIYKEGRDSIPANVYTAKRWTDSIQKQRKLENLFQNRPADYTPNATQ